MPYRNHISNVRKLSSTAIRKCESTIPALGLYGIVLEKRVAINVLSQSKTEDTHVRDANMYKYYLSLS